MKKFKVGTSVTSGEKTKHVAAQIRSKLVQVKNLKFLKEINVVDFMAGDGYQKDSNGEYINNNIAIQIGRLIYEFAQKPEYQHLTFRLIINDLSPTNIERLKQNEIFSQLASLKNVVLNAYQKDAYHLTHELVKRLCKTRDRYNIFVYDFNGFKGQGSSIGMPSLQDLNVLQIHNDMIMVISETAYNRSFSCQLPGFAKYNKPFIEYIAALLNDTNKALFKRLSTHDCHRFKVITYSAHLAQKETRSIKSFNREFKQLDYGTQTRIDY